MMKAKTFTAVAILASCWLSRVSADDPLTRSLARYAALKSYRDTGTILSEFAPGASYTHTFRTVFKAPRQFYFEFTADKRSGGRRIVFWCDGGDFQSWDSGLGLHNTYPRGSNTVLSGFATVASPTAGAITMIPSLLFAGSGLVSTITEFGDAAVAGTEEIGGRRAEKLVGVARSVYPKTQRETNVRRAIVWIDSESGLIRRVFDDTPKGLAASAVNRTTITINPQADPAIDDAAFRFAVPAAQR